MGEGGQGEGVEGAKNTRHKVKVSLSLSCLFGGSHKSHWVLEKESDTDCRAFYFSPASLSSQGSKISSHRNKHSVVVGGTGQAPPLFFTPRLDQLFRLLFCGDFDFSPSTAHVVLIH